MLSNLPLSEARVVQGAKPIIATPMQTLGALFFGITIIFAVGFMPLEAAHNATHDTRHVITFPCH